MISAILSFFLGIVLLFSSVQELKVAENIPLGVTLLLSGISFLASFILIALMNAKARTFFFVCLLSIFLSGWYFLVNHQKSIPLLNYSILVIGTIISIVLLIRWEAVLRRKERKRDRARYESW